MPKITSDYVPETITLVTASGEEFETFLDMPISARRRVDAALAEMNEITEQLEPYTDDDEELPEDLAKRATKGQIEFRDAAYDVLRSRVVPEERERFDATDIYERELYELVGELQKASDEKVSAESGRPTKKSSSRSRSSGAKKASRDSTES